METIDIVDYENYSSKTIVSFSEINVNINKEQLTRNIHIRNFFDNEGNRVFLRWGKKENKNEMISTIGTATISASCPGIGIRGERVKAMNNMCCFDFIYDKKSFHIKLSDKGILCVGTCSFDVTKNVVETFIKIIENIEDDIKKIRELKKEQFDFILNILKHGCCKNGVLLRKYEIEKSKIFKKEFSPIYISSDLCTQGNARGNDRGNARGNALGHEKDMKNEKRIIDIFLNYINDYDKIEDFIEKCNSIYEKKEILYSPLQPIKIKEFKIFNSVYYFKTNLNTMLLRRIEFYQHITQNMNDDETEINMMCHTWHKHLPFVTVQDKSSDEKCQHVFSIYDTGTIKQISPSSPQDAYRNYKKFITSVNKFIKEENRTFLKDVKKVEIKKVKKPRKKNN
jgi:hypothetical protein